MFKYKNRVSAYGEKMVKTLTIKDTVYERLVNIKGKEESFSDLFERLAEKEKAGIMEFAGFLSAETAEKMRKAIAERRQKDKKPGTERKKRLEQLWS